MRILFSFFLLTLIVAPLSAESRPDIFTSAISIGVIKRIYTEEKAYIESNDAKHPFAPLAQFPKKLRGFSLDQFNHTQLADWYEQLHHGNEINISYEEIKQQPLSLVYTVYILTTIFHVEEEQPLRLDTLRKNIHSDALARQFLEHQETLSNLATAYFDKHVMDE